MGGGFISLLGGLIMLILSLLGKRVLMMYVFFFSLFFSSSFFLFFFFFFQKKKTFHSQLTSLPLSPTSQVTGEPLIQRPDDNEETLKNRLAVFHESTAPLRKYYQAHGVLSRINADLPPKYVGAQIAGVEAFHEALNA